jgi:recombination protein RecR
MPRILKFNNDILMRFPQSIQNLIDLFSELPSVGPKAAERFVFYLLEKAPEDLKKLSDTIIGLHEKTVVCKICFSYSEKNPCSVCSDEKRDRSALAIVADTRALIPIESTQDYKGLYFILGGELNPIEGVGPEKLNMKNLGLRLKERNIKEVILALNPTIEGESTALYLLKTIRALNIPELKITRIARGLPMGADIEYADEATLGNAIKFRNEI